MQPNVLLVIQYSVFFKDGSKTEKVSVEYPIGHRRRRAEGIPVLQAKFERNLATRLSPKKSAKILASALINRRWRVPLSMSL
jgi:2-methylcitrate dehydratase PrpD